MPKLDKNLSLMQKLTILVLLPLSCEFIFVAALTGVLLAADQDAKRLEAAKQTQTVCADVVKNIYKTTASAFLYPIQHDDLSKNAYSDGKAALSELLVRLRDSCAGDPRAKLSAEMITVLTNRLFRQLDPLLASSSPSMPSFLRTSNSVALLDHQILDSCAQITALEARVQSYRQHNINWKLLIFSVLAIGLIASVAASVAVLKYVHFDLVNRILIMLENTRRVSKRDKLNDVLEGKDELSELDRFIHAMEKALRQSEQRQRELASMLTHDMRAPLAQFQFFMVMLEEGRFHDNPSKLKSTVRKLAPELNRLTRLIENLLTVDKVDTEKFAINKQPADTEVLLNEVREALDAEAQVSDKVLQCKTIKADLLMDAFEIKRVLINLCSNAIKHTPPGSLIELHCREDGDSMLFEVIDNGPGLTEVEKSTIFERYQQGETREPQGFGLGLFIAKKIVEAHGGQIAASNRSDGNTGAVFSFRIPFDPEKRATSAE